MSPSLRASNEGLLRPRVARAQGTHRAIPPLLADCFSIVLRYHGVFRQGKRGKALPAQSIMVHAGGAAPGTTIGVGAMLNCYPRGC